MEEALRLLLIDDNEEDYFTLLQMISRSPFGMVSKRPILDWILDYDRALSALMEGSYEAYLVDYNVDGQSGLDLLRTASSLDCKSPIILLTSEGYYEIDMAAMQLGAADYLVKSELTPLLLERSIRYAIDRNRQQEKLRRSELALRKAQNTARMGTWVWFAQDDRVEFSDEIYHLFKIADPVNTAIRSWNIDGILQKWIHPDDRQNLEQVVLTSRATDKNFGLECRAVWPDGSLRNVWIEVVEQVRDSSGRHILVTGIAQDITDHIRMEKVLLQTEKMAGLGTMAAGMAHEINTPLQVITGASEILQNKLNDGIVPGFDELKRQIDHIYTNAWRIASIVRSLLDYARIPSEKTVPCSLNDIVKATLPLTVKQFLAWSNIDISTSLLPDLPLTICDPNKMTQVLVNLLNNARDAMPDGGRIMIETSLDISVNQVVLRVIDNGVGIPEAIQSRIFDPFFTSKSQGKNCGLGLSIALGIVQAAGGVLELENSSKTGSVFKMALPVFTQPKSKETAGSVSAEFNHWPGYQPPGLYGNSHTQHR